MRSNGGDVVSGKHVFYTSSIEQRVDQTPVWEGACLNWKKKFLCPDRRFAALYGVNASGVSPITIADHYRHVDRVSINPVAPLEVTT